eukprot:m.74585 g.74585  ORF g.74585 m.74585 type:complete len:66 (+) comp50345_c0_seq4:1409-1606(+)
MASVEPSTELRETNIDQVLAPVGLAEASLEAAGSHATDYESPQGASLTVCSIRASLSPPPTLRPP